MIPARLSGWRLFCARAAAGGPAGPATRQRFRFLEAARCRLFSYTSSPVAERSALDAPARLAYVGASASPRTTAPALRRLCIILLVPCLGRVSPSRSSAPCPPAVGRPVADMTVSRDRCRAIAKPLAAAPLSHRSTCAVGVVAAASRHFRLGGSRPKRSPLRGFSIACPIIWYAACPSGRPPPRGPTTTT